MVAAMVRVLREKRLTVRGVWYQACQTPTPHADPLTQRRLAESLLQFASFMSVADCLRQTRAHVVLDARCIVAVPSPLNGLYNTGALMRSRRSNTPTALRTRAGQLFKCGIKQDYAVAATLHPGPPPVHKAQHPSVGARCILRASRVWAGRGAPSTLPPFKRAPKRRGAPSASPASWRRCR